MTTPDHPLPAAGGSFYRLPDGSLIPAEEYEAQQAAGGTPEAAADAPVQTTVKRGAKAPAKEG